MNDDLQAFVEWLKGRDEIFKLIIAWPPGTKATSCKEAPLTIPAPGSPRFRGHVARCYP